MSKPNLDLCERIAAEAREERICPECGYERRYRRVWRMQPVTLVNGLVGCPSVLRGALKLVCEGCQPEFVVNPYPVVNKITLEVLES